VERPWNVNLLRRFYTQCSKNRPISRLIGRLIRSRELTV
jgi:hypothetical protein